MVGFEQITGCFPQHMRGQPVIRSSVSADLLLQRRRDKPFKQRMWAVGP